MTAQQRFERGFMPVTESGCWLWVGSCNQYGYGHFTFHGKSMGAHRFAFQNYVGSIPEGLIVDHVCRVRCCVNPLHLRLTTNKENVLSGVGHTAKNARKTHCIHGHELTASNVRNRPNGGRGCLTCHKEWNRKYLATQKRIYANGLAHRGRAGG